MCFDLALKTCVMRKWGKWKCTYANKKWLWTQWFLRWSIIVHVLWTSLALNERCILFALIVYICICYNWILWYIYFWIKVHNGSIKLTFFMFLCQSFSPLRINFLLVCWKTCRKHCYYKYRSRATQVGEVCTEWVSF